MSAHYALMSERCDQCLTTKRRIVSGARAAELVRSCQADDVKFECHKASIAGTSIACRGVHEISPCRAYRFARAIGIAVVEYDPKTLEPVEIPSSQLGVRRT